MSDYTPSNPATFLTTITTIDDNDEPSGLTFSTPLEQLADNIAILATHYIAQVTGASANEFPLTEVSQSGGFTKDVNNRVKVPVEGTYLVTLSGDITLASGTDNYVRIMKNVGSGDEEIARFTLKETGVTTCGFGLTAPFVVADASSDVLFFKCSDTGADASGFGTFVTIRRIK